MAKQRRSKRKEHEMHLPGPLPFPKGKVIKVNPTDEPVFKGVNGRCFKIWPDVHEGFYWTTEYDKELKQRIHLLRVIPKKQKESA